MLVTMVSTEETFFASFVYAYNSAHDRDRLWKALREQGKVLIGKSWIRLGDFNVIKFL